MIKVKDWLLANNLYDESILIDADDSAVSFFFDTNYYESHVLRVEKVNDYTCKLYTDYKRA